MIFIICLWGFQSKTNCTLNRNLNIFGSLLVKTVYTELSAIKTLQRFYISCSSVWTRERKWFKTYKQFSILDHFSSGRTDSNSQNKYHLLICLFKDTHSSLEISMLLIAPTDFYLVACYRKVSLTCCLFFSASGKFQFTPPLQESRKLVSLHLCTWDQKRKPDTKPTYKVMF